MKSSVFCPVTQGKLKQKRSLHPGLHWGSEAKGALWSGIQEHSPLISPVAKHITNTHMPVSLMHHEHLKTLSHILTGADRQHGAYARGPYNGEKGNHI